MNDLPKNYRKDALLVFLLLAFFFAFFYQDATWNGNSRFGLIFAGVEKHSLSIDDYYNQEPTITGDHAFSNGHYYSDKAIGPAIIGALLYTPIYWLRSITGHPSLETVKIILTFVEIGLPSAFAGALLYLFCLYLSRSRVRSFLVTLAITLGTLYFPYSITFFSHQFTSSLIFSAFFMIFFLKESSKVRRGGYLFAIGLLLGLAVISEFTCAVIVLPLVIYYLSIIWKKTGTSRWHSVLLPLLGGLIPLAIQLVYNKLCFNNFFSIGYSNLDNQYFSSSMGQGIMGILWPNVQVLFFMTLHPALGLFWQSPVLLLAFIGTYFGLKQKKYRCEIILAVWIIVSYLVVLSGYYMWWGGYALGARHILPILPFFSLLLIFLPKKFDWALIGLGIVSIGQMLIGAASTIQVPDTMIGQLGSIGFFSYSNIYSFCLQQLLNHGFNDNLASHFLHLREWSSLIPLGIVFAAAILLFFWQELMPKKVQG